MWPEADSWHSWIIQALSRKRGPFPVSTVLNWARRPRYSRFMTRAFGLQSLWVWKNERAGSSQSFVLFCRYPHRKTPGSHGVRWPWCLNAHNGGQDRPRENIDGWNFARMKDKRHETAVTAAQIGIL